MDKNVNSWPPNFKGLMCQRGGENVDVYQFHRDPWVSNYMGNMINQPVFAEKKIFSRVEIARCLEFWRAWLTKSADLIGHLEWARCGIFEVGHFSFDPSEYFFSQSKSILDPLKMSLKWFSTHLKGCGCCICSKNILFKGRDCLVSGILTCLTDKVCWSDRPPGMSQIRDFRSWVTSLLTLRDFFWRSKFTLDPLNMFLK